MDMTTSDSPDRAPSTPPPSTSGSGSGCGGSGSGSGAGSARSGVSLGTPTVVEYHNIAVYLGEGKVYDWHADEKSQGTRHVMYNAFPADESEAHFFFAQTLTPMTSGNVYEVSARHSSSIWATRDRKVIPVRLHSRGTPSVGEYIKVQELPRDVIVGESKDYNMYALIGVIAVAPTKQTMTKEGRSFDLTTILIHVLDNEGELHLTKIKMWGNAPADARKGSAFRAIGLTKSHYQGDTSFEASKLTAIAWNYKDPKDRADARDVADIKRAVAMEESDDLDVREVEVVLPKGAPRLGSGAAAASPSAGAAAASTSAGAAAAVSTAASTTSAKRTSARTTYKSNKSRRVGLRVDDDEEEEDE